MEQALESIADELGFGEDGSLGQVDDRDELPAFGLTDAIARGDLHIVNVLVVWGRIRPADRAPIGLRWDPSIKVAEGDMVRVLRTIRFEPADKVLEQQRPNEVQMASATRPHVDGVSIQVAIRRDAAASAYLGFASGPLMLSVPATSLPVLRQYTVIDGAGNGLMLMSMDDFDDGTGACSHGFMAGRWAKTQEHGGVFGGRLLSDDGAQVGFIAGRYGEHQFHAKLIHLDGRFLGLAAGVYGDGEYRGEVFGSDGLPLGVLAGHTTATEEGGHGQFRGLWTRGCRPDRPCDGVACQPSCVDEACQPSL